MIRLSASVKLRCALAVSAARLAAYSATSLRCPALAAVVRALLAACSLACCSRSCLALRILLRRLFRRAISPWRSSAAVVDTVLGVLLVVDLLRLPHHVGDLRRETFFALTHPVVTHRFGPRGVRPHLGAIQSHPTHLHHPRLLTQLQSLQEQSTMDRKSGAVFAAKNRNATSSWQRVAILRGDRTPVV